MHAACLDPEHSTRPASHVSLLRITGGRFCGAAGIGYRKHQQAGNRIGWPDSLGKWFSQF